MTDLAPSTPLAALDAAVLDTETTSLDAAVAEIVQIAVVPVDRGRLVPEAAFETRINPGIPIPPATSAVHGLTDRDVADAPRFADVMPELESAIGRRVVVGHTITYDMAVIRRAYAGAGRPAPAWRTLDIRSLAQVALPGLADHSLDRLCEWLRVPIKGRHTALGDAEATAAAFLALLPHLRARNIRTLAEAETAVRRLAEPGGAGSLPYAASVAPPAEAPMQRIDSFAYRARIADVMSSPPLTVASDTTQAAVLKLLMAQGASSVFVAMDATRTGIVTERDLLRAIDAEGAAALTQPVGQIAKAPLECVRADDFVYRAIGRVGRLGFRHLGVTDADRRLIGAVTTRDLLRHRATTAIVLGDEIDHAADAGALGLAFAKVPQVAASLLADAIPARQVAAVISAEICATTARAAQLAESAMAAAGEGPPPQPYAVLVLGSAGRGESQLAPDQDNAIVYADGAEGGDADRWFEAMATRMNAILDVAGIPFCKGGVMAKNRAWRKSLADWTATVDGWVRRQRPADLLSVDIFFDAVAVHGERSFAERLWNHAYARAHAARDFQNLLVESARHPAPAFTLFGGFRVDTGGRLDLKKTGLMPMFTAARVLSIRHDVRRRSSADRLIGAAAAGGLTPEVADSLIAAQETLLATVLGQQLIDREAGLPPTPRAVPARLDAPARERLREALKLVPTAVDLAAEGRI